MENVKQTTQCSVQYTVYTATKLTTARYCKYDSWHSWQRFLDSILLSTINSHNVNTLSNDCIQFVTLMIFVTLAK